MSDTSQGPGWWQASDGKWYAPELYPKDWPAPNPEAAAETADGGASTAESAEAVVESPVSETVEQTPDEVAEVPIADANGDAGTVSEPPSTPTVSEPPSTPAVSEPPSTPAVSEPPSAPAVSEPPSDWATPDPAQGEPSVFSNIPPVVADSAPAEPARVQDAVDPSAPRFAAPAEGPPDTWGSSHAEPLMSTPSASDTASVAGVAASAPSPDAPAGVLAILGALALVVGSFVAWAKAAGTLTSGTVNGLTGSNGWGTLVCGLIAAAGGAMLLAGVRKWWVGAGIAAAAAVGVGLVVFSILDIGDTSDGLPAVLKEAGVDATTADGAKLDLDVGIWIVAAGGAVALVAGLVALARRD